MIFNLKPTFQWTTWQTKHCYSFQHRTMLANFVRAPTWGFPSVGQTFSSSANFRSRHVHRVIRPIYAHGMENKNLSTIVREQSGFREQDAIIIVDHGSRRQDSNSMLLAFVDMYKEKTGHPIVEPAHMEIAKPTIKEAFDSCVNQGAVRVIISPYFLSPGRHWKQDIPALAEEAAKEHPGIPYIVTAPLGLHDLMVVAKIRFASYIIVLRRLVQVKDALQGMVISNNWGVWKQKNTKRANKIKERLLADSWWEHVGYLLKITEPIMSMLRYTDMDRPCLGEIDDGIDSMIEKIRQVINEQEQDPQETFFKQVQKIINERWNKMTTPLHLLAYALTPKYYSSQYYDLPGRLPLYRDMEVSDGYQATFRRIFPDDDIRDVIMDEFIAFVNATSLSNDALRHQFKKHAHGWWYLHGQKFRTLQPLAIKVISQNIVEDRIKYCLSHVAGDSSECEMCSGSGQCQQRSA